MITEKTHKTFTELVLENNALKMKLTESLNKNREVRRANYALTKQATELQTIIDTLHTELWLAKGGYDSKM